MSTVNIIPMSGKGTRFADVGYLLPKYLIPVSGKPMIFKVIESLPTADKWIFIVRKDHISRYAIDQMIKQKIPQAVIVIDEDPVGQASTCMLAMPHVDASDSLLIAACDNAFLYDKSKYAALTKDSSIDAVVWTFTDDPLLEASPQSWGWVKLQSDNFTIDTMSVKVPVSEKPRHDHAVVATFFFRKAKDFIEAFNLMNEAGYRINGELYVDSMPIFMRKLGKKSVIFDVDLYVSWGKPADLYLYEYNEFLYTQGRQPDGRWKKYFDAPNDKRSLIRKQVPRFVVAGISAVACDSIVYFILIHIMSHSPAKAISFLSGAIVAYAFNKYWTFEKREKNSVELLTFFLLYSFTLLINVGINRVSLDVLSGQSGRVMIAFLLATGTSTALNFIGQKWVVFK